MTHYKAVGSESFPHARSLQFVFYSSPAVLLPLERQKTYTKTIGDDTAADRQHIASPQGIKFLTNSRKYQLW